MTKILLVEDDILLSKMYAQKFKKDGYEVSTAADGQEGLSLIKSTKPDVILLDIMMPKMSGLQVLEKIKADKQFKSIPVLLLTNLARGMDDINRGLELGAVSYLVKSKVKPADVVSKVKEVLKASGKNSVEEISSKAKPDSSQ